MEATSLAAPLSAFISQRKSEARVECRVSDLLRSQIENMSDGFREWTAGDLCLGRRNSLSSSTSGSPPSPASKSGESELDGMELDAALALACFSREAVLESSGRSKRPKNRSPARDVEDSIKKQDLTFATELGILLEECASPERDLNQESSTRRSQSRATSLQREIHSSWDSSGSKSHSGIINSSSLFFLFFSQVREAHCCRLF